MKDVSLHAIKVNTGSADENGCLALADGKLVAVLVELSGVEHGENRGLWFLEAAFGPCKNSDEMTFATIDDACKWLGGLL